MARPERKNADYFPFYAKDGRTLFILEGKYRCKGTGFFTNVMRFLTLQDNHHFCIADETDQMYFMSKCHCDEELGMDMLNIMVKTEKLDKELWENHKIIACQDLLDSLKDAYRKRTNDIITIDEIRVNAGIKWNSGGRNPVKGGSKPQRKGKETKGKETKGTTGKKSIPKTFPITEQMKSYAQKKGYIACLEYLTEGFLIHYKSEGNKKACWYSAWQRWLRNQMEWYPEKNVPKGEQPLTKIQPKTYAQAQDAERRDRAKWLLEEKDEGKQKADTKRIDHA